MIWIKRNLGKLGLAGQKKKSLWDDLVQIFKSSTNTPIFGLLPIPKHYAAAAKTVVTLLNQVEQQQRLIPLPSDKKLDVRLYDEASTSPFLLKPGFWLLMEGQEAVSHIDQTSHNIDDLVLDIPGKRYEVKYRNGMPWTCRAVFPGYSCPRSKYGMEGTWVASRCVLTRPKQR